MSNYTEDEVRERIKALTPRAFSFSRKEPVTGDELVASVQDLIQRTMHSHIDAIYFLLQLAVRRQLAIATSLTQCLDFLDRAVLAANNPPVKADASKLTGLSDVLAAVQGEEGTARDRLITRAGVLATEFLHSSRSSDSAAGIRMSRTDARRVIPGILTKLMAGAVSLDNQAQAFRDARRNFTRARLVGAAVAQQAASARSALSGRLVTEDQDLTTSVVDALIFTELLKRRCTPLDVAQDKYNAAATRIVALPGQLVGTGLPYVPTATDQATVEFDSTTEGTLTVSAAPVAVATLRADMVRSEAGVHATRGDGANLIFAWTLKPDVVKGTIEIATASGGNTFTVRDKAADSTLREWDGASFVGPSLGAINYVSGAFTLTYVPGDEPDTAEALYCGYDYSLFGPTDAYTEFKVFDGNTLRVVTLDYSTALEDASDLDTALTAEFAGVFDVVAAGDDVELRTTTGGTHQRVMFPIYSDSSVPNPAFGGAKWTTPPANANVALGARATITASGQGEDRYLADIAVAAAITSAGTVSSQPQQFLSEVSEVTVAGGRDELPVTSVVGLAVGDRVLVSSPVAAMHEITVVNASSVTLGTEILAPADSGETLADPMDVSFSVVREELLVTSLKTTEGTRVFVDDGDEGLGLLSGSDKGTTAGVTLAAAPALELSIRAGDPVFEGDAQIGYVRTIDGLTLLCDYTTAPVIPVTAVRIRSLGEWTYTQVVYTLGPLVGSLRTLVTGESARAEYGVYGGSGVGYTQFLRATTNLRAKVAEFRVALEAYTGGLSAPMQGALRFLQGEGLSHPYELLLTLNFAGLAGMTPEEVSQQASVENALADVLAEFDGEQELVEWSTVDPLVNDYGE